MKSATTESARHWLHRCALIAGLLVILATGGQTADIVSQQCRPGQIAWRMRGTLMDTTRGGVGLVYTRDSLVGVRLADGAILWERPTINQRKRHLCLFNKSRRVFVADIDREAGQSLIGMLDATTGVALWNRTIPLVKEGTRGLTIFCRGMPSTNYLQLRDGYRLRMYVSKKDGRTLWQNSNRRSGTPFARQDAVVSVDYPDGFLAIGEQPRTVTGQEPRTGRILWEFEIPVGFGPLFEYNYPLLYGGNYLAPTSTYAINVTSGEPSWIAVGEPQYLLPPFASLPSSDIYVFRRKTSQYCRLDAYTGEDIWCIPYNPRTNLIKLMAGTGDILLRHSDGSKNELQRLDKNTGELIYAADVEERLIFSSGIYGTVPASFHEVPVGRGKDTYLTDNGSVARISKNFTTIWRTSVPEETFGPRDPWRFLQFLTRIGQQVIFSYETRDDIPRFIKLASFNRKTGRIAWLVDENESTIGFREDGFGEKILLFAHDNLAVFSYRPSFFPRIQPPGVGDAEVRAVRTSCRAT